MLAPTYASNNTWFVPAYLNNGGTPAGYDNTNSHYPPIPAFPEFVNSFCCTPLESPKTDDRPPIIGVETFNNRAVIVRFSDGSFTKAVCGKDDVFDLDTGITICLLKRALSKTNGTKRYNNLLRKIHKMMADEAKQKILAANEKAEREKKARKKKAKAEARRQQRLADLGNAIRKAFDDSREDDGK